MFVGFVRYFWGLLCLWVVCIVGFLVDVSLGVFSFYACFNSLIFVGYFFAGFGFVCLIVSFPAGSGLLCFGFCA